MKASVLIISADTHFCQSVLGELAQAHSHALTVRSGAEAIGLLKCNEFSLVICDNDGGGNDLVGMDAMQFLCVANILLQRRPPVAVCSSRHRYSPEEFLFNGAAEVFAKPFCPQDLRAFLHRQNGRHASKRDSDPEFCPLEL